MTHTRTHTHLSLQAFLELIGGPQFPADGAVESLGQTLVLRVDGDLAQLGLGEVPHEAQDHDPDVQRGLPVLLVLEAEEGLPEGSLDVGVCGLALEVGLRKLDELVV